jgi:putative endonuclease
MASHNDFGKQAEEHATVWLSERGYKILHRNWTYGKLEIDIIARKDKYLHFVEVKARHGNEFGNPEESVTRSKFKKLQRAANEYLFRFGQVDWICFDIVAITYFVNREPDFFLIEDLFL